jgi:hypothetical protein
MPAVSAATISMASRAIAISRAFPTSIGPRDLGAYELQQACGVSDTIFCDSFDVQ